MISFRQSIILLSLWLAPCIAFSARSIATRTQRRKHSSTGTVIFYSEDSLDHADAAEPLQLTQEDLRMLTEMRRRQVTIPILLLDCILPGQNLDLSSSDPKFVELLKYTMKSSNSNEVGIIGFNPHNGEPLNRGVTVTLDKENFTYGIKENFEPGLSVSLKGKRCFQVVGEPWLDETDSFFLANIEISDNRKETMSTEEEEKALQIFQNIPKQVEEWMDLVMDTKESGEDDLVQILEVIGPMPDSLHQRALWVGKLVNPSQTTLDVCTDIRPAMLACRHDHDRMILASCALQSSINGMLEM